MAAKPDIPLGDNHRRGISTTFRLLDKLLCEIEEYARGREVRSIFYREKNTLSADQKKGLLAEIKQMRDLMQEVKGGLGLDAEVENVAARIWGHSSGFWEILVETTSRHLRRYGMPPAELAEYLDPRMEKLIAHLTSLTKLASGRQKNLEFAVGRGRGDMKRCWTSGGLSRIVTAVRWAFAHVDRANVNNVAAPAGGGAEGSGNDELLGSSEPAG